MPRIKPLISTSFDVNFLIIWFVKLLDFLRHLQIVEKVCRNTFHYRQKHVINPVKTLYPREMANDMAHDLVCDVRA